MPIFVDDPERKAETSRPPAYCTRSSVSDETDRMDKSDKYASASAPPSSSYQRPTTQSRTIPDIYAPPVFDGVHPDPESLLAHFKRYVSCRQLTEEDQLAFFPLFLKGAAIDWYDTLMATQKQSIDELLALFGQFFCPSPLDHVMDAEMVFTRMQRQGEKVRDYFSAMQKLAKRIPGVDDDLLRGILVRGLLPQIKAFVLQHQAQVKSIGDILEVARVAETAGMLNMAAAQNDMAGVMDEIRASRAEVRQLSSRVDRMTVSAVGGASPGRSPTPEARHVTFAANMPEDRRSPSRYDARGRGNVSSVEATPDGRTLRRRDLHNKTHGPATAVVGRTTGHAQPLTLTVSLVAGGAT